MLLVAVIAASCAVQTTYADGTGWSNDVLFIGGDARYDNTINTGVTFTPDDAETADVNEAFTSIEIADATSKTDYTELKIYAELNKNDSDSANKASIGELKVNADVTVNVCANPWDHETGTNRFFDALTIDKLSVTNGGAAALNISKAEHVVNVGEISGSLSSATVAGTLTIGTESATSASHSLGAVTVAQGGSLVLAGGTYTLGNGSAQSVQSAGEIVVKINATLKFAGVDMAHWSNATNITIDGGEWDGGTTRQSLCGSSVLNLVNGTITSATNDDGSSKYGDGISVVEFASDSGTLKSSGQSSITGGVAVNWSRTLAVNVLDGTLSIDTIVSDQGGGQITKSGDGTLKFTKMSANAKNHAFYTGNTTLQAGTIEYAIDKLSDSSTLDGSYTGTISGTGNIAKSGTGTVTLANVNNLDGEISVTGGTLNITTLSLNKTMTVTQDGGTLNITTLNTDMTSWVPSSKSLKYYEYVDGLATESTTGNGFLADESTYQLFDGYAWTGTMEGYTTSNEGGNTYLTANGDISTNYHVTNTGTTVNTADVSGATGFSIGAGTTLNVNSSIGADGITVTGADANITLSEGTSLETTQVHSNEGASINYTVNSANLKINETGANSDIKSINISGSGEVFISSPGGIIGTESDAVEIVMKDTATLKLQNANAYNPSMYVDMQIESAESGVSLLGGLYGTIAIKGNINGAGKLKMAPSENEWFNPMHIDALIADKSATETLAIENSANVTLTAANTYSGGTTITDKTLTAANESALGTGKVTVQGGTLTQSTALSVSAMDYTSGTVNNNGQNLTVTGKLTAAADMSIEGAGTTSIGSLDLSAGTTLTAAGSLTIGELVLDLSKYTDMAQTYTLVTTTGEGATVGLTTAYSTEYNGYTASVSGSGTDSLTLSFSEIVAPDTSIITTVTGQSGFADGMLTLNVAADLTDATQVLISGISDSIMADILGLSLPENGMVGITLAGADGATFTAEADQQIGFQGNDGVSYYFGEQVGSAWQYQVAYIPEPASATLGLAALMMLAARRRRKA